MPIECQNTRILSFPKEKRTLPGGAIETRQLWWSKSVQDSHCFCYMKAKTVVQSLMRPQKLRFWAKDSQYLPSWVAKILIGSEIGAPNQCMIHTAFAKGGLKLSFKSLCTVQNCYSELRILISCRHGWPKFWFASKFVVKVGCWPGRFAARFSLPLQMEASECCSPSLGGSKIAILS